MLTSPSPKPEKGFGEVQDKQGIEGWQPQTNLFFLEEPSAAVSCNDGERWQANRTTVFAQMPNIFTATIRWNREGAAFTDNRYSRGHEWAFDGGVVVSASSSPHSVPLPYSIANAVDPEEALVAAAASCHMLWFLSLAAKQGFAVESYCDEAFGTLEKNEAGKQRFGRITLRPNITWAGTPPSQERVQALHESAHAECMIANSLKCDVVVEG